MLEWRENATKIKECGGCDYLNICGQGCRARAYYSSGYYNAKDPLSIGPIKRDEKR